MIIVYYTCTLWNINKRRSKSFIQLYGKPVWRKVPRKTTNLCRSRDISRKENWPIRKSEFKDLEMDKENKETEENFLTIFEWQFGLNKKSLNYRCWEQSIYWYYEKLQILSLLPYNVQRTYKLEKLVCFLKSSWTVHKLLC